MEEIRARAVTKLKELKEIKPKQYTAMELHRRRPLLERVQRQEQRRHHRRIQERKVKLKKDITRIDAYLSSVRSQREYFERQPKNGEIGLNIMQSAPVVLPAPVIVFGKKPMLKKTRLRRYKRGRR